MNEEEKKVYKAWLKSFGRCVSTRRRQLGLTQKEASKLAGMNKTFYCDIEYGRRPITTRTLFHLCLRFDLPVPYNEAVKFICD